MVKTDENMSASQLLRARTRAGTQSLRLCSHRSERHRKLIVLCFCFVASVDVASDEAVLQKHDITHILSTTSMKLEYFPGRFSYEHVPIDDLPSTDITKNFEECFSFINEALLSGGKVLVHCMAGVSRSATIVIAYVMKSKAMDFKQAFDHVKSCRPAICPNEGFLNQLRHYKP